MEEIQTKKNYPKHIAFIVDGNRRWAEARGLPTLEGHRKGVEALERVLDAARERGIKCASAWVFSTENWTRSKDEVTYLFGLFRSFADKYKKKCMEEKIRFVHLGRKDRIEGDIKKVIEDLEESTKDFTDYTFALALDYGGHDELIRTLTKLKDKGLEITKENIEANLDTTSLPPVDLIIRTSGEQRLSGFLSWQCAYSELYFPKVTFPDFTPEELDKALEDYSQRERRFGGDSKTKAK
jgi:undecaprenyl diphosphate synthase